MYRNIFELAFHHNWNRINHSIERVMMKYFKLHDRKKRWPPVLVLDRRFCPGNTKILWITRTNIGNCRFWSVNCRLLSKAHDTSATQGGKSATAAFAFWLPTLSASYLFRRFCFNSFWVTRTLETKFWFQECLLLH